MRVSIGSSITQCSSRPWASVRSNRLRCEGTSACSASGTAGTSNPSPRPCWHSARRANLVNGEAIAFSRNQLYRTGST